MRATRLGLAAAAIVAALVTSPRASGAQTPTFPSQVELVTVDAIVLGEKGRPVRGLTREDFTLSEDGKLQEIVSFEAFDGAEVAEEAPRRPSPVASNTSTPEHRAGAFVLLVDDLGIDARRLPRLLKALSGVLQSSFRAGDEVTLATASGSLWWGIRFPEGREDLPFLLERATTRKLPELGDHYMTDYEAYQISNHERLVVGPDAAATELPAHLGRVVRRWMSTTGCLSNRVDSCAHTVQARATERDSERRARTLAILAALERAVFSLTGVRGRKELLLFSDGFVYDRGLQEVRQVAGICREANVVVSFLDARGNLPALPETQASFAGPPPDLADMGKAALEQRGDEIGGALGLTEDTGGVAVTVRDVTTGNHTAWHITKLLIFAGYRKLVSRGVGYRALVGFFNWFQRLRGGKPYPLGHGFIPDGKPTPTEDLDLRVGEWVQVRSQEEIQQTITESGLNRGMRYDLEMSKYCGNRYRVQMRVDRLINEQTGKMMQMKNACIQLEHVYCRAECTTKRLGCPRASNTYWREIWLRRIEPPGDPPTNLSA